MSKSTHSKLTKQQSTNSDRNVVSDTELDSLLEEVEMIQKKEKSKKSITRKSAGDNLFTKEDEKALKEIFNNVERRKKEFEELRLASSQSCRDIKDDGLDSTSSESSKSSSDNESEDNDSSSKVSDDNSSDQESVDDEVDLTTDDEDNSRVNEKKQQHSKKKLNNGANSIDDEENPSTNGTGKKTSGFNDKHTKKVQKTKSASNRDLQAEGDLDSMVAELLEF